MRIYIVKFIQTYKIGQNYCMEIAVRKMDQVHNYSAKQKSVRREDGLRVEQVHFKILFLCENYSQKSGPQKTPI